VIEAHVVVPYVEVRRYSRLSRFIAARCLVETAPQEKSVACVDAKRAD
jgi:hypothetical protein